MLFSKCFKNNWKNLVFTTIFISVSLIAQSILAIAQEQGGQKRVKFVIESIDGKQRQRKHSFKVGEDIFIRAIIKNDTDLPFREIVASNYSQYGFELKKVGSRRLESNRKDKRESIYTSWQSPGFFSKFIPRPIESGKSREVSRLNLSDWYENLAVGKYMLVVIYKQDEHRRIRSNPLIIEIVP